MNYLGVDYGSKRIGLALASDEVKIARPLRTIANDDQIMATFAAILTGESVGEVIWGLPRGLEGQETAQTMIARGAAEQLVQHLPVHFQDEAVTSELAAERGAAKHELDAEAAAIILQDYLDAL
jgi:putative Holliday junction resolvase